MKKISDIHRKIDLMILLVILPMIGISITRKPMASYMEFPPLTHYVEHAPFSWPIFIVFAFIIIAVFAAIIRKILLSQQLVKPMQENRRSAFPWWGWFGIILTACSWFIAWNRFACFEAIQLFTFTPIWLGYILVVNALSYRKSGHCIMIDRPVYFLFLFVVSSAFWWYFEYLNRFVQNWYYKGIDGMTPWKYFIFATLPFSTVLPAVLSTREFLEHIPKISAGMNDFIRINFSHKRVYAWTSLIISCFCLAMIGVWPNYLYPLLWLSPLLIITSWRAIAGQKTIFSDISNGDWKNIYLLAISALICGFFWELWNYKSLGKWIYAVPFVGKFKLFEMPILGYTGYLPFGLECAVVADIIMHKQNSPTVYFEKETLSNPACFNLCKYIKFLSYPLWLFIFS